MGGRRHAGGVERLDVLGVLEHGAQLLGERSSSSAVSASRARRATWATSSVEMRVAMAAMRRRASRRALPGYGRARYLRAGMLIGRPIRAAKTGAVA